MTDPTPNPWPAKLKAWMTTQNHTLGTAAIALGIPGKTLQNWLYGRRSPQGLAAVELERRLTQ